MEESKRIRRIYKKLSAFFFHECKVSKSRNNCKSAAAHTENRRNLRNNSRCHCLLVVNTSKSF